MPRLICNATRIPMLNRLLVALALTVPFSVDLPAQLPPGFTQKSSLDSFHYPLHSGNFERIDVLQPCAPKHYRDAIVLRGGELGRVVALGIWNHIVPLGVAGPSSDFVVVPRHPLHSEYDRLLVTAPASSYVTLVSWTGQQTQGFVQASLPQFAGARQLTVASTASGHDLAGVGPDGTTVLRAAVAGGSVTYVSAFDTTRPIQSIALGDRNGDGELEVFCVIDLGVLILNRQGGVVALVPSSHPGGLVTAVGSRVLWLARRPDDLGWNLRYVCGGGDFSAPVDVALNGGDFTPVGMRPTNGDQQGELDVVITQSTTQQLLLVRLQMITPPAPHAVCEVIPMSATPLASGATYTCPAAVANLDGDAFSDYALASSLAATVTIARGTADGRVFASPIGELLADHTYFQHDGPGGLEDRLELRLNDLEELFGQDNFTQVKVSLWIQQDSTSTVTGQGAFHGIYDITQSTSPEQTVQRLDVPAWVTPHQPFSYHHLEIVFLDANGDPGPVFTVAGYCHDSEVGATEGNYIENQDQLLFDLSYDGSDPDRIYKKPTGGGDRILIGGHVRSARMPPAYPFPTPPPTPPTTGSTQPTN
jgi:hypothetical protein